MADDDRRLIEELADMPPRQRGGGWELSLLRIENKLDLIMARHDARITQVEADSKDHAVRIRQIEVTPFVRASHLGWAVGAITPFAIVLITILSRGSQ